MTNNSSHLNTTESGCGINWDTVNEYSFYFFIVCSVLSFVGNILVVLTVYKTKTLRTTTNVFVVNMALSDVFVPTWDLLRVGLLSRKDAPVLTQYLGNAFCKVIPFLINVSYGVSMLSLVVITVHRFYAVVFPMRARLESRKTRALLLLCTWLAPISVCCSQLYGAVYIPEERTCYFNISKQHFTAWIITFQVLFFALPFLFMLVLYPVIIIKLLRQKVPGNSSSYSHVRKRKRNIRITTMFITIILLLLLTYGTFQGSYIVLYLFSLVSDGCLAIKVLNVVFPLRNLFHAINPVIYFIFCIYYRQGIKQIFSSCSQCTIRCNLPVCGQIELENLPQE